MRPTWLLATTLGLAACSSEEAPQMTMPAPARLVQALSAVEDLGATAYLVPRQGVPSAGTALARGDDGVSFSGFVAAQPGDYTIEVVFDGVPAGGASRTFLGRWTSSAFTVSAGSSVAPTFSQPLDTIGRPEDGGDADGDGLGALDEILWGSALDNPDSDGDGVRDGDDCTPFDAADATTVAPGGSQEDCDGDSVVRADLPYGQPGLDCNDHDATIKPGAVDDCSDEIDQDCNPSTCPIDDDSGPSITNISPSDGAAVGCHRSIHADIRDATGVSSANVVLEGATTSGDAMLFMTKASGDEWVSTPLNRSTAIEGLVNGVRTARITATDPNLNETVATQSYTLQLEVPVINSFLPASVGDVSAPFDVTVAASASAGIASITVMAAPLNAQDLYSIGTATELGRSTSSPATMTVDAGGLADGSYMLYAVVEDAVGNKLEPFSVAAAIGGANGLTTSADFNCLRSPTGFSTPVRLFTKGANPYRPSTMRVHLDEAIAIAANQDAAAQLVSIIGFGVDSDGHVRLDRAESYSTWIQYSFYNSTSQRYVSVTWRTQAWGSDNPLVDPDAGNVTAEDPILDPSGLVDSDAATAAAVAGGCAMLTGSESDAIQYTNVGGQDVVSVNKDGGGYWRGTAHAPITEIFACQ